MKKLLILSLLVSLNAYAARIVSSERSYIDKFLTSKNIENKISNKFDYNNDIAVISDLKDSSEGSLFDAKKGLEKAISSYAYGKLKNLLEETNLIGPGFNEVKMKQLANDIASKYIYTEKYDLSGVWQVSGEYKYYTLLKIDKKLLDSYITAIFKIRLEKVIQSLNNLKEGI